MASRAEVLRLRSDGQRIVTLALRDLRSAWGSLDLSRPEAARDALLRVTPTLVTKYGDAAAVVAADWYDELRAGDPHVSRRQRFSATMADTVATERVQESVRYFAGHLFTDAPQMTLDALGGAVQRFVLEPARETVVISARNDPQSNGWYRVSGGGCDFCDMLAERGAVYSEQSADFAAHNNCNCGVAPSWDPTRPEADVRQYEASARTSAMTDQERVDHNATLRMYLEDRRTAPEAAAS